MSVVAPPQAKCSLAVQGALIAALNALDDAQHPVARVSVTVGVTPWDDCCVGQLYARIDRLYRSDRFPIEGALQPCATPTAALIVVGLVRCFPPIQEGAQAPPAEGETMAALGLYEDAAIVWTGLSDDWWSDAVIVEAQQFLALGGCCCVETQVYVELV